MESFLPSMSGMKSNSINLETSQPTRPGLDQPWSGWLVEVDFKEQTGILFPPCSVVLVTVDNAPKLHSHTDTHILSHFGRMCPPRRTEAINGLRRFFLYTLCSQSVIWIRKRRKPSKRNHRAMFELLTGPNFSECVCVRLCSVS